MAANTSANTGLLLNDDDDAPVPFVTPARFDAPALAGDTVLPNSVQVSRLVHPADASPELVQRALDWIACPVPTLGFRALLLAVSGLNLGISRRERDLRLLYCALYRAAYLQPDPER